MLLLLLLVANSSLALEIVTHDRHGHGQIILSDVSDVYEVGSVHGHHPGQATGTESGTQDDQCFCDELCCFSPVGFVAPLAAGVNPHAISHSETLPAHYKSISLDLLLPPPTR